MSSTTPAPWCAASSSSWPCSSSALAFTSHSLASGPGPTRPSSSFTATSTFGRGFKSAGCPSSGGARPPSTSTPCLQPRPNRCAAVTFPFTLHSARFVCLASVLQIVDDIFTRLINTFMQLHLIGSSFAKF